MGPWSLAVVLPKDWTRGMGISLGDEVEVTYNGIVRIRKCEQMADGGPAD